MADGVRERPEQSYEFWYDMPQRIQSLNRASVQAAIEFWRRHSNKEIVILYSGGLDSEWVCEAFWQARVPFTPLVVDYCGANEHDLVWARRWLDLRKITNTIWWRFDLRAWYGSSEQLEIAEASQLAELAYTGQYKAVLEHSTGNRIFVSGYDEPVITADDSGTDRNWLLTYNERHYSIHKFFAHYGIPTEPGGWLDANVFAAYIHCPMWQWLVANLGNKMMWNSELVKARIYGTAFPALVPRPKYTGFENMLDIVVPATNRWHRTCVEKHGTRFLQDWSRPIKEVWESMAHLQYTSEAPEMETTA